MDINQQHWQDVEVLGTWVWPRFSLQKMACQHCGRIEINGAFMDRLSALREEFDQPMMETSGYRCPVHNSNISKTGETGPHTTGRAVDINIWGKSAHKLMGMASAHGFTGIGIRQTGMYKRRFIHLDDLDEAEGCPRPWVWSY